MPLCVGRLGSRGVGLLATAVLSGGALAALVGRQVLVHPQRAVVGFNPASDFQIMTWSLRWWPWALSRGHDGLDTTLLWAPHGFSTLWMTSIPVPALLGLPVTLTAGPLAAYNVLMFAAVVLAACAMFLLCYELTRSVHASMVAGLVFGLSPYMLGHTLSEHLDLTMVFPLPLMALVAVRFVHGATSRGRAVAAFAGLLLVLVGSAFELAVDLTVMLVPLGLLVATVRGPLRPTVRRAAALVAAAYVVCLPVLVPVAVLGFMAAHGAVQHPPSAYAVDLFNVVLPTPTILVGRFHAVQEVTRHFVGNIGERDGYLGPPLLVLSVLGLRASWRRGGWLAGLLVGIALVLSLGPIVAVGGRPLLRLPFALDSLPVLGNTLPARLSVFVVLGASVLSAVWFARPMPRRIRVGAGALLVASLLPNAAAAPNMARSWPTTSHFGWSTSRAPVGFLGDARWHKLIPAGANVLVLPTEDRTAAEYWQAASGLGFGLAVPETPFTPPAVAADPTVVGLVDDVLPRRDGPALGAARLRAFLIMNRIRAVVVARSGVHEWARLVRRAVSVAPESLGRTLLFRVDRQLRPARAVGDLLLARLAPGRRPLLRAWLAFDGRRARLRASLAGHGVVRLSSAAGDAQSRWSVGPTGRASVAFTEFSRGVLRLRIAVHGRGSWQVTTLDRARQPIPAARTTVAPDGTIFATWIAETGSQQTLRAASLSPTGVWRIQTLEQGPTLGSLALRAFPGGVCAIAWSDAVAGESRVRAAVFAADRWRRPLTLGSSLDGVDEVSLARAVPVAAFRLWNDGRPKSMRSHYLGTHWTAPLLS